MKRKKFFNCVVLSALDKPVLIFRWFRFRYFFRYFRKPGLQPVPVKDALI